MPYLFQAYLKQNLSLFKFTYFNEPMLREIAIDDFCKSATFTQKYNQIIKMLVEYSNIFNFSNLDHNFPKEKLVATFSYLLRDYVTLSFSLIYVIRETSKQKITRNLSDFNKYNPLYGRKIIVSKYNLNSSEPFIFGDKTRTYTIEYKFIDTVVTRPPIRLKRRRKKTLMNTNRRDRHSLVRANTNTVVRRAVPHNTQIMSTIELDLLFSLSLISESENIIIGEGSTNASYNNLNTYTAIENTNQYDETESDDDTNMSDDMSLFPLGDEYSSDESR
jgi:hypothetical protein